MHDTELHPDHGLKTVYIYALVDPETDKIRYIGKSIRPMERLTNHMNDKSSCHRSHWLQSLKSRGLMPVMLILEEITGAWPWQESERYWIKRGKKLGWPLTNNTDGGDGVSGLPEETRKRMASVWLGRKHTDESRAKISRNRTGTLHSDETKAKMSDAHKGRKITWGKALSEAQIKFTVEQENEIRNRIKNGAKVKDIAVEYGSHRTTISKIKLGTYRLSRPE